MAVTIPEVAIPFEPVTAVMPPAIVALAPLPGTVKVTVAPGTGLLPASSTVAVNTAPKAVLMAVVWLAPLVAVIEAAAPAVFVKLKLTPVTLGTEATTLYVPAVELAVSVPEVATPFEPVMAVMPPPMVARAPLTGAVKVTVAPLTGLPPASTTVATKGAPKAVLMVVVWPDPLVTLMEAAGPAVFVRLKLAAATLGTVAATT